MIYENKYYSVQIIEEEDADQYCYKVVNKEFNTAEHKSYTLSGAVAVADQLGAELDRIQSKLNPDTAAVHYLSPKSIN